LTPPNKNANLGQRYFHEVKGDYKKIRVHPRSSVVPELWRAQLRKALRKTLRRSREQLLKLLRFRSRTGNGAIVDDLAQLHHNHSIGQFQ